MMNASRTARARASSILGEALEAGAALLASHLQAELGKPLASASRGLALGLGFSNWDDLARNSIQATSRRVDPRLLPLIDLGSDEQLASRVARALGAQPDRVGTALRKFRESAVTVN